VIDEPLERRQERLEDLRREMAVILSRIDRHDGDISQLTVSLNALREKIDYQHNTVITKLDHLQTQWIDRFQEHSRQDLEADQQIIRQVAEAKQTATSTRNYVIGIGVGIPVMFQILDFLVGSGLLIHVK
jgi:predicted nuclease with TOPRIM domain